MRFWGDWDALSDGAGKEAGTSLHVASSKGKWSAWQLNKQPKCQRKKAERLKTGARETEVEKTKRQ